MTTDRQVRRLRELLIRGETLSRAAWKTGMDRKTAGKYRDGKLPSERARDHDWRTRDDPFAEVWDEVHEQLSENPEPAGQGPVRLAATAVPGTISRWPIANVSTRRETLASYGGAGEGSVLQPGSQARSTYVRPTSPT